MEVPGQEPNWEEIVGRGWDLHTTPDSMLSYYEGIVERFPDSARAYFEYGNALDFAEKESEAIVCYHKALKLGLEPPLRVFAFIQLGSSYRNIGRSVSAISALEEALALAPGDGAVRIFYCLALYSAGEPVHALKAALSYILQDADSATQKRYGEVLRRYLSDLA